MFHADNEKWEKRRAEGIKLLIKNSLEQLERKKYNYAGISEVDTIKKAAIKEKQLEKASEKNKKAFLNNSLPLKSCQKNNHLDTPT